MHRAEPRPPPASSRATRLLLLSLLIVATIPSAAQSRRQDNLVVTPATATLAIGETLQLAVSNAAGAVTWTSNDTTVATVTAGGLVTARNIGDGAARIQAKYKNQRGWCDVIVTPGAPPTNQAPTAIISSPAADVTLEEGASVSFAGSGTDPDGSVVGYTWAFQGGVPAASGVAAPGTVTYPTPGLFTASLTVQDEDGAVSPATTRAITVTAAPVIIPPPTETAPAPPTSVALIGSGSGSMVDNPTAVQFVPSSDHSTLEGYDRRTVHVASGSITEVMDMGVPTPSGGVCTVPISTAGWTPDAAYRIEVRSARSSLTSAWVPSAQTGRRVSTPPTETGDFYVATTGSDSNSGAIDAPFRTVLKGISMLTPGATLLIRGGNYPALVWPSGAAGTAWTSALTVKAYPGETVNFDGYIRFVGSGNRQYVILDGLTVVGSATTLVADTAFQVDGPSNHHVRFINGEVHNSPRSSVYVGGNAHHNEFINLDINDGDATAVYFNTSTDNILDGCDISNTGVDNGQNHFAFQITTQGGTSDRNIVRNNRLHGTKDRPGSGGGYVGSGSNNLVYNNLVYDNNKGIDIGSGTGNKLLHNTIYGNFGESIQVISGSGHVVRNNIIRNNTYNAPQYFVSTTNSNNLMSDPLFVNAAAFDFHLQAGSPAINAGVAVAEVATDFDGVTRGNPPEIGAYEKP